MRQADRDATYRAAELWVDSALRTDGSLFTPGKRIWTAQVVESLYEHFNLQPDEGGDTFEDKFRRQLANSSPETIQLAGELVFFHLLIASDITAVTKRGLVDRILGWSSVPVAMPDVLAAGLERGLANTGLAFKTYRPHQLWFLIEFLRKWKSLPEEERGVCLEDPWAFRSLVYDVPQGSAYSQREALLHLVFPDTYENIVSRDHKTKIVEAFGDRIRDASADYDQKLLQIRESLTSEYGHEINFYGADLAPTWRGEASPRLTERNTATCFSYPLATKQLARTSPAR